MLDIYHLKEKSPSQWAEHVVEHFDTFLQDHAACERKASALAMSFVVKYPDRSLLIDPMIALAREELEHFQQVYHLIRQRGQALVAKDEKDLYVNEILKSLRHGRDERFLDRLIMSGLVEARGNERFSLLADHLDDPQLKKFYKDLALKEAGHCKIFIKIAKQYFDENHVEEALERISIIESKAMLASPVCSKLH